jgi:hypothetical protein
VVLRRRGHALTWGVDEAARARRIARLHGELADELVPLPIDGPAGPALLAELDYALHPPVHEGRIPTYGAVVDVGADPASPSGGAGACRLGPSALQPDSGDGVESRGSGRGPEVGQPFADRGGAARPSQVGEPFAVGCRRIGARLDPDLQRMAADGRTTFTWRPLDRPGGLLTLARGHEHEADLVDLRELLGDVVVVQRDRAGQVRAVTSEGVVIWNTVEWVFKPAARRHLRALVRLMPGIDTVVLASLLDLCVHWLSAAGVGATLVWWLDDDGDGAPDRVNGAGPGPGGLDRSTARPARSLSVADRRHHPAVLGLLAQVDRAAVVARDGELLEIGVGLVPSAESLVAVAAAGGTRHSSARRYAFDQPRCVVFVVSADGPVTVFSDGASAAQVRVDPCRVGLPAGITDAVSGGRDVTCPTCGRHLLVDVTDLPGWTGGPDVQPCPVCAGAVVVDVYRAAIRGALKGPSDVAGRRVSLG